MIPILVGAGLLLALACVGIVIYKRDGWRGFAFVAAGGLLVVLWLYGPGLWHRLADDRSDFYCYSGNCERSEKGCAFMRDLNFKRGYSVEKCHGRDSAYCYDSSGDEFCFEDRSRCIEVADEKRKYGDVTGCEER